MSKLTVQDIYQFPIDINLAGDTVIISLAEETTSTVRWENEEIELVVIASKNEQGNNWYVCQLLPNGHFIEAKNSNLQKALTLFHLEKLLAL